MGLTGESGFRTQDVGSSPIDPVDPDGWSLKQLLVMMFYKNLTNMKRAILVGIYSIIFNKYM